MTNITCPHCGCDCSNLVGKFCPQCGKRFEQFVNNDARLRTVADQVLEKRAEAGLNGLVGGLTAVIINTEQDRLEAAAAEILQTTGHEFHEAFETDALRTIVLSQPGSADLLVQSRKMPTPFESVEAYPKAAKLPSSRLETLVFSTPDLRKYVDVQKKQGVDFMTDSPIELTDGQFAQTRPSQHTGLSYGFHETTKETDGYAPPDATSLDVSLDKPPLPHLRKIFELDHCATRVPARDRDPAILEFVALTNFTFRFAIYVPVLNSITNVARMDGEGYAQVFTSGIRPSTDTNASQDGPTEQFLRNYGRRVHHMAFRTDEIVDTIAALQDDGMEFLIDVVGSEEHGIRQTFSKPAKNTLLVNEYIERYGDFDGFFTQENVADLTESTLKQ
jgi:hypothetical protein